MSTTPVAVRPGATSAASAGLIDARGPQFGAAVTTGILAVVLLTAPHPVGLALLGAQAVCFAVGAFFGVQRTPHAWLFRTVVRPRLGAPTAFEEQAPPRFAQAVGLVFAVVALSAYGIGATLLGQIAVGLALTAALLNAAFAFCLGCELFLLARRVTA